MSQTLESLSERRFWATDETWSEDFACQDNDFYQIFEVIVSTSENILNYTNVVLWKQVK